MPWAAQSILQLLCFSAGAGLSMQEVVLPISQVTQVTLLMWPWGSPQMFYL